MSPRVIADLSWITLVLCALLSAQAHAQAEPVQRSAHLLSDREPAPVPVSVSSLSAGEIRARRLFVTMLVGGVSAMIGGLGAGLGTCWIESHLSADAWCLMPLMFYGPLGALAGGFAGAVITGSLMDSHGSLWAAFGAAALGVVIGGMAALMTTQFAIPVCAAVPGVLAALAFEATSFEVHPTLLRGGGGVAVSGYF